MSDGFKILTKQFSDNVEVEIMHVSTVMELCHAVAQVKRVSFFASRLQTLKQNVILNYLSQPVLAHVFQSFAERFPNLEIRAIQT